MLEITAKFLSKILVRRNTRILCIGMLFASSAISVSSTPAIKTGLAPKSVSQPRNYCSADVASLGTGLIIAPTESRAISPKNKGRRWIGWIRGAASGKYELSLPNNDGRILLSQKQIYGSSQGSNKADLIQVELLTNRYYAITVEVFDNENSPPLQWRRPDGRLENVPTEYLYAPVAMSSGRESKTVH